MTEISGKDRMRAALDHRCPDRPPVGELETLPGAFCSRVLGRPSGMGAWSEKRNAELLWDGRRDELVASVIRDKLELTRLFKHDIVTVNLVPDRDRPAPERLMPAGAGRWTNRAGDVFMLSEGSYVWVKPGGQRRPPPYGLLPKKPDYRPTASETELVDAVKRAFGATHYIVTDLITGPPGLGYFRLWGRDDDWVYLYEHPAEWLSLMLDETEIVFGLTVKFAREWGLDGIIYDHDLGHNTGPFVSPELFARTIAPVMSRRSEILHAGGFKHILHSCGNNRALMDMLLDSGVEVYQSIQPQMSILELKKSFGDRLVLWGGVDAELLLPDAGERQLRARCREILRRCAAGGGYIYGTSHSIMPGAAPEKYRIMLEELEEYAGRLAGHG